MKSPDQLIALADRFEAEGESFRGSSELDCDLAEALGADVNRYHGRMGRAIRFIPWRHGRSYSWESLPNFSGSVDDALSLTKAHLPNWRIGVQTDGDGVWEAIAENKGDFAAIEAQHTRSYAATPALAICATMLHALATKATAS